ncbi:MAG: DUF3592 domain-containing protein [Pseudomonadota bacterium]
MSARSVHTKSMSARSMSGQSKNLLVILALAALAAAGSFAYRWNDSRLAGLPEASLDWPSVKGLIVQSALRDKHTDCIVRVVYEYVVGEQSYRNDVVRFDQAEITVREKEALVSSHPVGRTVSVYYNPDEPGQSVLVRGAATR